MKTNLSRNQKRMRLAFTKERAGAVPLRSSGSVNVRNFGG
jgi:hypothetical protein